jgi:hypothetical protein
MNEGSFSLLIAADSLVANALLIDDDKQPSFAETEFDPRRRPFCLITYLLYALLTLRYAPEGSRFLCACHWLSMWNAVGGAATQGGEHGRGSTRAVKGFFCGTKDAGGRVFRGL